MILFLFYNDKSVGVTAQTVQHVAFGTGPVFIKREECQCSIENNKCLSNSSITKVWRVSASFHEACYSIGKNCDEREQKLQHTSE